MFYSRCVFIGQNRLHRIQPVHKQLNGWLLKREAARVKAMYSVFSSFRKVSQFEIDIIIAYAIFLSCDGICTKTYLYNLLE